MTASRSRSAAIPAAPDCSARSRSRRGQGPSHNAHRTSAGGRPCRSNRAAVASRSTNASIRFDRCGSRSASSARNSASVQTWANVSGTAGSASEASSVGRVRNQRRSARRSAGPSPPSSELSTCSTSWEDNESRPQSKLRRAAAITAATAGCITSGKSSPGTLTGMCARPRLRMSSGRSCVAEADSTAMSRQGTPAARAARSRAAI